MGFNPDQPRVPAGNSDGGQWSGQGGGGAAAAGDGRVRLAGPTGALGRRQAIALRYPNATPAQQVRLAAWEAQADAAARAVREIDPHWRREPSFHETIEGQIAAEEAAANAARARLNLFGQLGINREATRPVPTPPSYRGLWFERSDGVRFGLRMSERHGPTIDLMTRDHPSFLHNLKVHQR